jgi:hypothetical protein
MRLMMALVALLLSGCASGQHLPDGLVSAAPAAEPAPALVHQAIEPFTTLPPCGPSVPSPCRLPPNDPPQRRIAETRPAASPAFYHGPRTRLPHCGDAGLSPCWLPDERPLQRPAMYYAPRTIEPRYSEPQRPPAQKAMLAPEPQHEQAKSKPQASPPADAKPSRDDAAVIAAIIRASRASYRGPCGCPFDTDRAGRSCGRRSAHDRPGGAVVHCSPADVSPTMIASYRAGRG